MQNVMSCFVLPLSSAAAFSRPFFGQQLAKTSKAPQHLTLRFSPRAQSVSSSVVQPVSSLSSQPANETTVHTKEPVEVRPSIHIESLNLLEWPQITAKVLSFASTELGRIALRDIDTPTHLYIPLSQSESEQLLQQTRELHHLENNLASPLSLGSAQNIAPLVAQTTKGRSLTGLDLRDVARTLGTARQLRREIMLHPPEELPTLFELIEPLRTAPFAEKEILRCIDEYGDVVESADPTLRSTRDAIRQTSADVRSELNNLMSRHSEAIQERVITTRYDRFVIPVKNSHKAIFRRAVVHDASASGNTAYVEPLSVKPFNDRLRQLAAKERAAVNAILRRLSLEIVAPLDTDVVQLCDVIAVLDAAAARARCSRTFDGVDVKFNNEVPLNLIGVRHPLLSWKAMETTRDEDEDEEQSKSVTKSESGNHKAVQEFKLSEEPAWKKAVVPSSYTLAKDVRCVCVTGPNTGGKTLSLKTLGVTALMARAGMFIPATRPGRIAMKLEDNNSSLDVEVEKETHKATLPYFDSVLADIGDDQSLVQSLSTFSGHVRRIKRILRATSKHSLVLLDEIGSGTDPAEGAALGMAILRDLAVRGRAALTFATTHHGELKTLKYATDGTGELFENASVEFDDVRMAPTYRLVWGIPGRSNALSIAERLGMDRSVVLEARHLLNGTKDGESDSRMDIEQMIVSLERDKRDAENARRNAERAFLEVDGLRDELRQRLGKLRESEGDLRREQRAAMDAEVGEARKQIARVIKDMQRGGGSAQAASQASEKIKSLHLQGDKSGQKRTRQGGGIVADEIQVGDMVTVPSLGDGEVEVVDKASKKEVMVGMGAMKAKVKIRDIATVRRGGEPSGVVEQTQYRSGMGLSNGGGGEKEGKKDLAVRTAANTIDIRGERVDTAESKVDVAIDRALGMGMLWVVHGHGTGRLRNGIRKFLAAHELVRKIEDAERHDGGNGCTVAYLN